MRRWVVSIVAVSVLALFAGCASHGKYHAGDLPDPKGFNAHFGDMDSGKNGAVDWPEFKAYFPKAEPKVFAAIDLNKDGVIDHDEWHKFKAAHGLKHKD
jgi:hypothetical protein